MLDPSHAALAMRMLLSLLPALLLGLVVLNGCGDDEAEAASTYAAQVNPLMVRNGQLARLFLDLATRIRNEQLDAQSVARVFEEQVIPLADGLARDVANIQPALPQLQALHANLVEAWKERARAYHDLLEAFKAADPQAFETAHQVNVRAKLAEEQYFQQLNALLVPYGLRVDQFPGT